MSSTILRRSSGLAKKKLARRDGMKSITCQLPESLYTAVRARVAAEQGSIDHIVAMALADYLETPLHTLFQVSTSAALVEGVYQGAVRVSRLLQHGDFGLGTFTHLDGEIVVLDGVCYQVFPTGSLSPVEGERLIPYAVVTRFSSSFRKKYQRIPTLDALVQACDQLRDSNNVFYAFRVNGKFEAVKTRVMKSVPKGTTLKAAASAQQEFRFEKLRGTLVGIWSPAFAASFSVPGCHFHFLSEDRKNGGHVLDCHLSEVEIDGCAMNEMHVSLPETEDFLKADLTRDPEADLMKAERSHGS
jgi:acetolactate decarboxylase